MKLVILNGSSCSGKSTIIKEILKQKENYFHLSYDTLKWSFSQYESNKYYEDVQKIIISVADTVFKMNYNIITDNSLKREFRVKLIYLANSYGYEILEINLEASLEVLSKRFEDRIAGVLQNPERRIANLSKDRFKELYDTFQAEKNPLAIRFRTDNQSIENVSENIMKLL